MQIDGPCREVVAHGAVEGHHAHPGDGPVLGVSPLDETESKT